MHVFSALPLTGKVHWVGGIDWNLREMHGYETRRGTTYNAFLIMADKVTLVDTVKRDRQDELLARIRSVIDPTRIDYIVSLHAEMDHSGCLPEVMAAVKPERVFASKHGRRALGEHFGFTDEITEVEDGTVIDLGNMKLSCLTTPMLHWPDSMIAYLHEERVLFTQDAFGMHLASAERFADELPRDILEYEAAKYFANILLPYAKLIPKLHDRLAATGWDLATIAPDHGPVWRQEKWILGKYLEWARQENHDHAIVLYESMWGATEKMAQAITEGMASTGVYVELMRLEANHQSHVAAQLLHAGALLVGSPTLNGELFPSVAACLTYLKGLRRKNLIGCAFGSYGWGGGAVKAIDQYLDAMGVRRIGDSISTRYMPTRENLALLHERGRQLGEAMKGQAGTAGEMPS